MSFFRSSAPAERRSFPEPLISPVYGGNGSGGGLGASPTVDTALAQSAVWACTHLVADVVSMMPCNSFVWRGDQRVPTERPSLLKNPSADATFSEWVYMLVMSAMLRGNSLGEIMQKDPMGYPTQIELWNPDTVQGGVANGLATYKVDGQVVDRKSVAHFRTYRMPGTPWGLSPIRYAALAINREAAIQSFAYGYFNDAPHPQAVLTSDQPINDTEAETIKKRLMAKLVGREPLVLGAGAKYQPLSVSPEESQFLATQKLGVAEIARIYSVPPEMIAAEAGNSMTYANVEQRGISFLTYSIQPFLAKLEDFISSMLPGKNHVRFDPSVLLRTDYHTLVQANSVGIASKQITPDEARAKMDLPPLTQTQKDILELVPLTVSPSGRPIVQPIGAGAPIADLTPNNPPQGAPA